MAGPLTGLVRGARPHQWTKNLLVFAAPVAGGVIDEGDVVLNTVGAFVAFCLASAGTYLLNDARDVEADRRHPTKRHRPLASGQVSLGLGYVAGGLLIVAAVALGFVVSVALGVTIVGYLALTTAYSFGLKHVPVVDLVAVATGFVLRAVAGAAATGIPVSEWFFIVTSAGALLMITGKREAELAGQATRHDSDVGAAPDATVGDELEGTTRQVLDAYSAGFLLSVRSIAAGLVLIAYCLWAFEGPATSTVINADAEVWFRASIAPFTVAVLRYALLIDEGRGEEPERLVLRDRILLGAGAAWAIIYAYGVYVA